MTTYIINRLLLLVPTLLGISLLVFISLHLIPGDPVLALVRVEGEIDEEVLEHLREQFGLNDPLPVQFVRFVGGLLRGDFGKSFISGMPVLDLIMERYPRTIVLAFSALGIALLLGVPLGVVAALKPHSFVANLSSFVSLIGLSVPGFYLGLMLIYLFGITLGWLPVIGLESPRHLIMPAFVLSFFSLAFIARMTRSGMIEVLQRDYVTTARAKGLRERAVIFQHALKNALIPVISIAGLSLGYSLGGAVLAETVFSIHGLGTLIVEGVLRRDFPVVQGGILFVAVNFVVVNLAVDIIYAFLDPRIRYRKA